MELRCNQCSICSQCKTCRRRDSFALGQKVLKHCAPRQCAVCNVSADPVTTSSGGRSVSRSDKLICEICISLGYSVRGTTSYSCAGGHQRGHAAFSASSFSFPMPFPETRNLWSLGHFGHASARASALSCVSFIRICVFRVPTRVAYCVIIQQNQQKRFRRQK